MVGKTIWDEPRTKTLDEICADMSSGASDVGAEVECCEAAPGNLAYACAECGCTLAGGEDGWFDEKRGDHGGIAYRPRFNFCPECGRMVERRWQPQSK